MNKKWTGGVLAVTILFWGTVGILADIPVEERDALIAIYNATNGDDWTDNQGWRNKPLETHTLPGG